MYVNTKENNTIQVYDGILFIISEIGKVHSTTSFIPLNWCVTYKIHEKLSDSENTCYLWQKLLITFEIFE